MATRTKKTAMTAEHKAALAQGRAEGRAVRLYLEALDEHRPKRGRKRTADSVRKQLAKVEADLKSATGVDKLELLQQRRDLDAELATMGEAADLSELEDGFVKVARAYGDRKGISYATWREFGVAPDVLKKAGIGRGA